MSETKKNEQGGQGEQPVVEKKKLTLDRKVVRGVTVQTGVRAGIVPVAARAGWHWC